MSLRDQSYPVLVSHLYPRFARFNIKKFVYADDLAIMYSSRNWQVLDGALNQDMAILSLYLKKIET